MTTLKTLCGSQQTVENSQRWEDTLPVSWETYMQIKKQQLESYMEKLTDSKLGKEFFEAVYCHPVYLTYIQSHHQNARLYKAQAGIKIAGRNINNLKYADNTTLMADRERN